MENMPGSWPGSPKLLYSTPPQSPELSLSTPPQSPELSFLTPQSSPTLSLPTPQSYPQNSLLFPSHMRSIIPHQCRKNVILCPDKRRQGNKPDSSRMIAMESQRRRLKRLLRDRDDSLDMYKRKLELTSVKVQKKEAMIAGMKEDKLALERRIEEQVEQHRERANKLQIAEFRAELYEALDKKGDDKLICKLREDVKVQWLRANSAEEHVRRLEPLLTRANSEIEQGRCARDKIEMLQQKLDTSVANAQKADYQIQELRKALDASNNHAKDIRQQAVAHIQSLEEAARQEVQRLIKLGTQVEARANDVELTNKSLQQTVTEQATAIKTLQHEAQKWQNLAEGHSKKASVAARELEEKKQQLEERTGQANKAEAEVERLKQKISNLEDAAAQEGEAATEPSPDSEAACVPTKPNDRLERELEEAIELLEELLASGMDTACRDVLDTLVSTNQCFKLIEAEFEGYHVPSVDAVNDILVDAVANLNDLHLIENGDRPVLVRQLKEAHGVRVRIDEVIEDAQLLNLVYLEEEEAEKIKQILESPRTLPDIEDTAPSSSSPPPATPPPPTSTTTPLYNPPRPQQTPSTTPSQLPSLHLPGLHLTNPTASPTTGAPPPFNPLWDTLQPAAPSPPAPSALVSLGSSLLPLLNNLPPATSTAAAAASLSDSDDDSDDDDKLPEAFAGQYDEESSDEDEAPRAPPVGQREIRPAVSRRRRPQYLKAADFM